MAITNLINTTWVFKSNDFLNCRSLGFETSYYINFTSNSTSYHQIYKEQPDQVDELYYGYENPKQEGTYVIELVYTGDPYNIYTGDFTWTNTNYQTIQITGGQDVHDSDLIKFLSDNATCQTPLVTVTFNMNGIGTAVSSQTFARGTKANMPIPSDDGYIFAGWYTDSDLTTRFNFNASIMSNRTLYAKWIPKAIKTKVSGAWNSGTPLVKVNNTWKDIDKMFVKVDGVWQPVIDNVLPTPVKCAEYSVAPDESSVNSSFTIGRYDYFSFKILTNDSFSFNIRVDFNEDMSWWGFGIHSSKAPNGSGGTLYIDNSMLESFDSYVGAINIPGGNINKYIIIYFDCEAGGGHSSTVTFLSNFYSGCIYDYLIK